ncbi:SCO family protein [Yoonia sp. 208BN28-4]|uniref:SCO family protein n=1 Tax=Yoonia sp. 208BN28-4 TaxID=3126505 RepID=UPI0030A690D2
MIRAAFSMCLATPAVAETPAFLQAVGGDFALTDQTGATRTQASPDGTAQLLFFGYANCKQICSSVLPQMADVVDDLARDGVAVTPMMITVDETVDTVATLGPALREYHPDFVGLTGSQTELQVAYDAFQIEKEHLFDDPEYGPVYAHGSFLYLMDSAGAVLTIIPPVLTDDEITTIIANYVEPA